MKITQPVKKYTSINHISSIRRLPRLGKIRLGIKLKSKNGKDYPKEVDYFVCPPEVQAVYGETPKSLDIMIPLEDSSVFFPQALKMYKSSSLFCKGDGVTALRQGEGGMTEMECSCPFLTGDGGVKKQCRAVGNLMIFLPKVSMGGVYQIDMGQTSIIELNSCFSLIAGTVGRLAMVPLKLTRREREMTYKNESGELQKSTHYIMSAYFDGNIDTINHLRENKDRVLEDTKTLRIAPPVESGPEPTGEGIVISEETGEVIETPKVEVEPFVNEPFPGAVEVGNSTNTMVSKVTIKPINKKDGTQGKVYQIHNGLTVYETFSETFAQIAKDAMQAGTKINIIFTEDTYGRKVKSLQAI